AVDKHLRNPVSRLNAVLPLADSAAHVNHQSHSSSCVPLLPVCSKSAQPVLRVTQTTHRKECRQHAQHSPPGIT
ncbi:hypothetical protein B0H34DRAFT_734452, partial [Crassisporium funariophilum]